MLQDLRHALRVLLQTKGWTLVVLLSLALGLGVNTTLFSALNGLLLTSLPVHEPAALVRLLWSGDNDMSTSSSEYGYLTPLPSGEHVRATTSYSVYQELVEANETLTGLFACAPAGRVNVIVDDQAELASAFLSTGTYFRVLGIPAFIGRTLIPADDEPQAPPAAVISHRYWARRFGSDPAVVGRSVLVNNTAVTIVGVAPPGYVGIQRLGAQPADVHLPLRFEESVSSRDRLAQPTYWFLQVAGRLKPGVTPAQVEGNLGGVFRAAAQAGWDSYYGGLSDEERALSRHQDRDSVPSLQVSSAARGIYDTSPRSVRSLSILGVVALLILLIVCANVANLLLSRATLRRQEISVRLSLGATRSRLVRQLLTESVLLALIGGVLAMVVAWWSRQLLPVGETAALDWSVFGFAAALSALTGILFGLVPALRATGVDLAQSMNEAGRGISRTRTLLARSLLVLQVAISLVLLVGAGLFLRTLANLRNVDVGFDADNLLLVSVNPQVSGYDRERAEGLYLELQQAFRAVPGVESVSFAQIALLSGSTWSSSIHVQGDSGEERGSVHELIVSPEFLTTHQIPLLLGRGIQSGDTAEAPQVALLNQAAAREFFGTDNPLGRRFGFSPETVGDVEVVGVVADTKYNSVRDESPPTVYRPYLQARLRTATFHLRTALPADELTAAVREAVRRVDSNLPLGEITTQAEEVEGRISQERVFALTYTLFGTLALLLVSIGLFGLMSYHVTSRSGEIGVRMALGARQRCIVAMVLRESLLLVALGAVIGVAATLASGRLVASLLYDLEPGDPLTMAAAAAVLFAVAGIAGYLPARRAARVDPVTALHYD